MDTEPPPRRLHRRGLERRSERPGTVEALADHLADFVDYGLGTGGQALIADYELLLQAARDPELESLSRVFYERIRGQLESTLTELGARDPAVAA